MNNTATVFSKWYDVSLGKIMTTTQTEELLRESIAFIGRALAYNGIILGHIKILARLPEPVIDRYLFLSLTRLEQIDITPSKYWSKVSGIGLTHIELHVNVLIFGYTFSEVEAVITEALKKK
ncbi:hypothetical protein [Sporomusa aerivorans]|uniref:hypothetical protein n=1 Tax=Sporomusa aerivorans TaxID=204936 RepID=UPI00352B80CE